MFPDPGTGWYELSMIFYRLGRFLQLLGLLILPMAIAGNLADEERINLKVSLAMSAGGVLIFTIGWLLQQAAKPK
jgi:hypothetical protein